MAHWLQRDGEESEQDYPGGSGEASRQRRSTSIVGGDDLIGTKRGIRRNHNIRS